MNWITAKFKYECAGCTLNIYPGERILYDHEEREALCSKCGERVKARSERKPMAFNDLTAAESERLAILAEECAEVIQVVGKILRHGYYSFNPDLLTQEMDDGYELPPTNKSDLEKELGDVLFAVELMKQASDISMVKVEARAEVKAEKIKEYLHHQY